MRKFVIFFIFLMIIIFIFVSYMVFNDKKYQSMTKKDIIKNTDITTINYINKYDDYYIVMDTEYLYLIDEEYNIVLVKDLILVHENTNNYDIIYKDGSFLYLKDYYQKGLLVYEYYDIYTYELSDRVSVGG